MATTPSVTAATSPPVMTTIDKDLQDSLASLAHKHVTISYVLVALLVITLILGGIGAYFGAEWVDKEIATAQSAEKVMEQLQTTAATDAAAAQTAQQQYQTELVAHNADRTAWATQQAQLMSAYTKNNQAVAQQISQATTAGRSAQDAYADLHAAYKDNTMVESAPMAVSADPVTKEQLLTFPVPVVQQFTACKLDDGLQTANVASLTQQRILDKQTNDSTSIDLIAAQTALTTSQTALAASQAAEKQCQVTVADYKKVVLPSKVKRIMSGVAKGAIFVAGAVLGHYIP